MLPTPSTSHVAFERIYEPAEDSYLLLDTLSCEAEKAFLHDRFHKTPPGSTENIRASNSPLVLEIGTGSGVVISFVNAHAETIFGRSDIITLGVDVNRFACKATGQTVEMAQKEKVVQEKLHGFHLGNILGDLTRALKSEQVDILIFNPPYVPTSELPQMPMECASQVATYNDDSKLLSLSYAGGLDGMETTHRLLDNLGDVLCRTRGCAYILLCAQNKPETVKEGIRKWGPGWAAETVGSSGRKAGWEKLQVIRIWRTKELT
ncbi:S-adenosylmethionine-dependent methyltransferase [Cadophora gregata]|uniref:S-adenosylmethionine-dependent methyltransferase n=1 Tax=Cadophora gregata TaxID=51156 RepID=UPI0026DD15F7|nr:S-adenosylmethionine-dependent methyltransferase [Cadophora gregata]KAK0118749.1 S-adenosylmethionine-dependent methyltransferase [Cadophora gregata f. sp. sojae]KAK0126011.1 S-adenosylmethionine-dependent methyltransferase [Cadophora gregata]